MRVHLRIVCALWCAGIAATSRADVSREVALARAAVAKNDAAAAVEILESSLTTASAEDQKALLSELLTTYPSAIQRAEAAGDQARARSLRENLDILTKARAAKSGAIAPAANPPASATPKAPAPPATEPPKAPRAPAPVDPVPDPTDPQARPAAAMTPESLPDPTPDAVPAATPETPAPATDLNSADAAFRAGRYDEAGRIYQALSAENALPTSRKEHWAYCRCVGVVARINEGPSSPEDWAAIHSEIRAIRSLAPKNWFGEYLRRLAAERSSSQIPTGRPSGFVVRAASPETDEPAQQTTRPSTVPPPKRPTGWEASKPQSTTGGDALGQWQLRETTNFRIFHADPQLAERLADEAEKARDRIFEKWTGAVAKANWSPRCDIYVYPTRTIFAQKTGQPETTAGFSTMGLNGGRVVARRVNLHADADRVVEAVLPHEVTHIVLADLFPRVQIPRWADEGLAVLSEPDADQQDRARKLGDSLSTGQLFRLKTLMMTDYPDARFWDLFYDQSISLTRFLLETGTPADLIGFLQDAQANGYETELTRRYGIASFADLEAKWLEYARGRATPVDPKLQMAGAPAESTPR